MENLTPTILHPKTTLIQKKRTKTLQITAPLLPNLTMMNRSKRPITAATKENIKIQKAAEAINITLHYYNNNNMASERERVRSLTSPFRNLSDSINNNYFPRLSKSRFC